MIKILPSIFFKYAKFLSTQFCFLIPHPIAINRLYIHLIYYLIFSSFFLQLDQLVLALPSRDYYLKTSSEGDLKAYHRYMTQTAILLGANAESAAKELEHVVMFEKKLANVSIIKIEFCARFTSYLCLFNIFT